MWPFRRKRVGPELSPETLRRLEILFAPQDHEAAKKLLYERCGGKGDMYQHERMRFAALKYSDGKLLLLEGAVGLAEADFRDLLMSAGFGYDVEAHKRWEPKPAGEPADIDPLTLAAAMHHTMESVLSPMGFRRLENEWRRDGVPQIVRLETGLCSRTETTFFMRVMIDVEPTGVILQFPYAFRAGDSETALCALVNGDVIRHVRPSLEKFTTGAEVAEGLKDGWFHPHIPVTGAPGMRAHEVAFMPFRYDEPGADLLA